jgi:hypothetical protein
LNVRRCQRFSKEKEKEKKEEGEGEEGRRRGNFRGEDSWNEVQRKRVSAFMPFQNAPSRELWAGY